MEPADFHGAGEKLCVRGRRLGETQAVCVQVRPLQAGALTSGQNMRVLRNKAVKRLLGNGYCRRPRELDC